MCARRMTRAELAAVTDAQGKGGVRTAPETGVREDEGKETPGLMEAGTWGVPWDR